MSAGLDHGVVLVRDLDAAVADYRALGFNVVPGGTHAGGLTHNALVPFANGTYLELLAFTRPDALPPVSALGEPGRTPLERRFIPRAQRGEGLIDVAIWVNDLAGSIARCVSTQQTDVAVEGPALGQRTRPDGARLAWRMAFPDAPDLPFLIEDVTPRRLRVPDGDATDHPNGVTGIAVATFAAVSPVQTASVLHDLVGLPEAAQPVHEAGRSTLRVGEGRIEFVGRSPGQPGPLALSLSAGRQGTLDPAAAHGARLVLI